MDLMICECGHTRYNHAQIGIADWDVCDICLESDKEYYQVCKKFKADNLKFLESKLGLDKITII